MVGPSPSGLAATLLFLVFLVGSAAIGLYLIAYASRCLLVVVHGTAGGQDRVTWPDEPILDWASHSLALVGLVFLWLIPVGFLSRALEDVLFPGQGVLRMLVLAGPALWLFFPIGSLSSLSSVSRWGFFRPVIVLRMLILFPSTLMFYLLSAVIVGLSLAMLGMSILRAPALLILTGPLSASLFLIYARLLGRLAWRIAQLGPMPTSEPDKRPSPHKAAPKKPRVRQSGFEVQDPWATPEDFEPVVAPGSHKSPTGLLEETNAEPYGLADPAKPQPEELPASQRPLDPEEEEIRSGYQVAAEQRTKRGETARPSRKPLRRRVGQRSAKPPGSAFGGVIGFPWYATSLSAWAWLSVGAVVLGFLLVGLVRFMPGA